MAFDGIFLSKIKEEIAACTDSRVDRIHQPAREELILTAGPELSPFLKDLPASVRREHVQKRERPAEQLSLFTLP